MQMASEEELQKADFDAIYDQPDPRAYYSTLRKFDYGIPEFGAEVFNEILSKRPSNGAGPFRILDLCCSYGIVATLMKTDLAMGDVYEHYCSEAVRSLTSDELNALDRRFLREHRRPGAPDVIGLDLAKRAIDYAVAAGTLDVGFAENLETDEPTAELAAQMEDIDLITTTGGVGYVTEHTFDRLLEVAPDTAWVASFCVRTYDYEPISRVLEEHGFQTEQMTRSFPQRKFIGPDEKTWAVAEVRSRGIDPAGKEQDGYFYADCFLSRPKAEVARAPLAELLPGLA